MLATRQPQLDLDELVYLRPRERQLLKIVMRAPGPIQMSTLAYCMYGYADRDELHALRMVVYRLRHRFEEHHAPWRLHLEQHSQFEPGSLRLERAP